MTVERDVEDMTKAQLRAHVTALRAEIARLQADVAHHTHQHKAILSWLREVSPSLFQQALKRGVDR